jgi:hypothetical protein
MPSQLQSTFAQRFAELEQSFGKIPYKSSQYEGRYVADGMWRGWATSVLSLFSAVFGETSAQWNHFKAAYDGCNGGESSVAALKALFLAAKDDFDGGYVFDADLRISGEVFGDFVVLAKQALSDGHKDVAAVLACAALEDALKRLALAKNLVVNDKTMSEIVNALKANGVVAGAQKSLLDAMPRIRNMAMHAEWSKISAPDVSSVLGFVEQLLLSKFNGN